MKTPVAFAASLLLLTFNFVSCAQDMERFERVIASKNGYDLKYKHIAAAVYIASEEMGADLADPQIDAIQQAILNAFNQDPATTAREMEQAWNTIINNSASDNASLSSNKGLQGQPALQQEWEQFLAGKALVRSVSSSEGGNGLYIANKMIEQYQLFPDGTFLAAMGSQAAGSNMGLAGYDDMMRGYWSVQSINNYQAILVFTVNGQSLQMPLQITGNQLFMAGKPMNVIPF